MPHNRSNKTKKKKICSNRANDLTHFSCIVQQFTVEFISDLIAFQLKCLHSLSDVVVDEAEQEARSSIEMHRKHCIGHKAINCVEFFFSENFLVCHRSIYNHFQMEFIGILV